MKYLVFLIYTIFWQSMVWIGGGYIVFFLEYSAWWLILVIVVSSSQYPPEKFGIKEGDSYYG